MPTNEVEGSHEGEKVKGGEERRGLKRGRVHIPSQHGSAEPQN